jgi:hypothetical protein
MRGITPPRLQFGNRCDFEITRRVSPTDEPSANGLHTRATMPERHATPFPPDPVSHVTLRPLARAVPRTKTSVDIMHERDAFRARVSQLEEALKIVERETELALRYSELHVLTMCRIACVARQAVGDDTGSRE